MFFPFIPPEKRYVVSMTTATMKKTKTFNPHEKINSGPTLQRWRRQIKISRPVYAELSDCALRTLATLERKNRLSLNKERKLNQTRRLIEALCEIMEPAHVAPWLQQPNDWFDGRTPLQAVKEGKIDKVWELIFHTKEGGYL